MSRTIAEQDANIQIREVKKSHLNADTFYYRDKLIKVGRDFITIGRVDGKRIYHLEQRDCFGSLLQSTSYFNIKDLKKDIRK